MLIRRKSVANEFKQLPFETSALRLMKRGAGADAAAFAELLEQQVVVALWRPASYFSSHDFDLRSWLLNLVLVHTPRSQQEHLHENGSRDRMCAPLAECWRCVAQQSELRTRGVVADVSFPAHPLQIDDTVRGVLNLLSTSPGMLTAADGALVQILADAAAIAVLQKRSSPTINLVEEQLQPDRYTRILIEQAEGILAQNQHLGPMQDFSTGLRGPAESPS